ncbi:MAG: M23 family metallopeptidase [Parerythrobacter sp.]
MPFVDRLLTIIVTATLTSAVWIVAGGSIMENAGADGQIGSTRPALAAPSPDGSEPAVDQAQAAASELDRVLEADDTTNTTLNRDNATTPAADEGKNLRIPVLNVRAADLTDTFTDKRGAGTRLHEAIDIMAPKGTSVVAAAPGVIERMFVSEAGGKTIYVRSQDGLTIHYYAHLGDYAEGLKDGQRVRRGQRLGTVGSTGNAAPEAPHLHFAILRTTKDAKWWEPANAINPYPLLAGTAE